MVFFKPWISKVKYILLATPRAVPVFSTKSVKPFKFKRVYVQKVTYVLIKDVSYLHTKLVQPFEREEVKNIQTHSLTFAFIILIRSRISKME